MSKTTKSTSNTRTSHNYDGISDEAEHTSSNEEEVVVPRPVKSKKMQPLDASDYDDNLYDRQGRNKRRRSGVKGKRRLRGRQSRSRSRRRR